MSPPNKDMIPPKNVTPSKKTVLLRKNSSGKKKKKMTPLEK